MAEHLSGSTNVVGSMVGGPSGFSGHPPLPMGAPVPGTAARAAAAGAAATAGSGSGFGGDPDGQAASQSEGSGQPPPGVTEADGPPRGDVAGRDEPGPPGPVLSGPRLAAPVAADSGATGGGEGGQPGRGGPAASPIPVASRPAAVGSPYSVFGGAGEPHAPGAPGNGGAAPSGVAGQDGGPPLYIGTAGPATGDAGRRDRLDLGPGDVVTAPDIFVGPDGALYADGGTINGNVHVQGGIFDPAITINGDLIIDSGVLRLFEGDEIDVSGNLIVGADAMVELYVSDPTSSIDLNDYLKVTGQDSILAIDAVLFATSYRFTVFTPSGGQLIDLYFMGINAPDNGPFHIQLLAVDPVPEPSTIGVLGFGLFGAGVIRRRKRRNSAVPGGPGRGDGVSRLPTHEFVILRSVPF